MDHIITVTVESTPGGGANRVRAVRNPHPGLSTGGSTPPPVRPGDTVIWTIAGGRVLQVLFMTDSSLGPFSSLFARAGQIVGSIDSNVPTEQNRRFLYSFYENGTRLAWINPVDEATDSGGIDIPMTPG